jgi:monoamine oxidase
MFMGCFIKILVFYKNAFWREKGYSGEVVSSNEDILHNPITYSFDASMKSKKDTTILYPALVHFIASKASMLWSKVRS